MNVKEILNTASIEAYIELYEIYGFEIVINDGQVENIRIQEDME